MVSYWKKLGLEELFTDNISSTLVERITQRGVGCNTSFSLICVKRIAWNRSKNILLGCLKGLSGILKICINGYYFITSPVICIWSLQVSFGL